MGNLRYKFLQVGCVIGLGAFLIANAKPLPQPDIEPQITAGASRFPIVDWRETKVTITPPQPEIETVAQAEPQIEEQQVAEIEIPTTDAVVYDKTFFELVVQAEGYTLGYEGMRYITSAIINLARSRGCSVDDVLTSGAYTVVNNGTVWKQNLYNETVQAVEDELVGQIDTEIKYFRTNHYHSFGTPCFSYGNVYFSK